MTDIEFYNKFGEIVDCEAKTMASVVRGVLSRKDLSEEEKAAEIVASSFDCLSCLITGALKEAGLLSHLESTL